MRPGHVLRHDGKEGLDYILHHMPRLDSIDANLGAFFQRQLEYIEDVIHFVEYGELKSWKHIPIESRGGDNLWYTWRLFDKVGKWKIAGTDADDVPEVNIMGAELPVPIRMLTGGFKYNVKELLSGKQAAANSNGPSLMIEQQKAIACFEAYQQIVDQICWFANPSSAEYSGLTGMFANPYISTTAAVAGVTDSNTKTMWFNASGVRQKEPVDIVTDLDNMLTAIKVATLDRYAADTVLMPIEHFNMLTNTPMSVQYPMLTIMKYWLGNHPEITTVDTLVAAKHVAAGGNLAAATDVILAYKKNPDVVKLAIPRQYTMQPIQERGFNYIVPCWATCAGLIVRSPKQCVCLSGPAITQSVRSFFSFAKSPLGGIGVPLKGFLTTSF